MVNDFVIIACSSAGGALIGATLTHIWESGRNRKSERNILRIMGDNFNHAVEKLNKDNEDLAAENSRLLLENKELKFKMKNKVT
jgi:hypothetical protein